MNSLLMEISGSLQAFFVRLIEMVGFVGLIGIIAGFEVLLILIYGLKSAFSYEARFKRCLDRANAYLFTNKKLTEENILAFTKLLKKGPKRITYFWQQYLMYREGGAKEYMSEDNLIEKPIRTSSWLNNVKNLNLCTIVWSIVAFMAGIATQSGGTLYSGILVALVFPLTTMCLGAIASILIKGQRAYNLEDVYHVYHVFARFVTNACDTLPPYIDLDLLYSKKELSKASSQLRDFYEANARKAREAFEEARRKDEKGQEYNFKDVGVDGGLLLDRAMLESETYLNQRTKTLSQIAQIKAQMDALRRNYENVQMDLQRKIQAAKENIQKLIEQQAATTSRIEVGLLRQQQDKEAKKLDDLQHDYDKEETRYKADRDEHEKEITRLTVIMDEGLKKAQKGMTAEYQSFFEKVMKSAYAVAEKKVEKEKKDLTKQKDANEKELISVQTQIKRLFDENQTLRAKLAEYNPQFKQERADAGHYNEEGNFIYSDGSYHDADGFFHDVDGNVYDMNGVKVDRDYDDEEIFQNEKEEIVNEQINQFGSFIDSNGAPLVGNNDIQIENDRTEQETAHESIVTEYSEEKSNNPTVAHDDLDALLDAMEVESPAQREETVEKEEDFQEEVEEKEIKEDNEPEEEITKPRPKPRKRVGENVAPAKKRGRPRKTTSEPKTTAPPKKRGRPAKVTTEIVQVPAKKRGRPRKVEEGGVATSPAKKRGRPAKVTIEVKRETPAKKRGRPAKVQAEEKPVEEKRGRGRPRKNQELDSLTQINKKISEEEEKLDKMTEKLNGQIDKVMVQNVSVDKEREKLLKEFESLTSQARSAKNGTNSQEELASINSRLEDLIKQIASLNNKK